MNLIIQLTPEDYVNANFVHMRPRPLIKWAGYFMLLLVVIVLPISIFDTGADQKDGFIPVIIVAGLAYLVFLFGFMHPRRLKKIFSQQKMLHAPHSLNITDEAISTKSEVGEAKLTWNYFPKWKEGKNIFLLYQSDVMFHLVPKRCFASLEEMAQFRKLMLEKIGSALQ